MKTRLSWTYGSGVAAIVVAVLAIPDADAWAGRGGHGGGHGGGHEARAPRVSAPRGGFKAPRMPRVMAPGRGSGHHTQARTNHSNAVAGHAKTHNNSSLTASHSSPKLATNATPTARGAGTRTVNPATGNGTGAARGGATGPLTAGALGASTVHPTGLYGNSYTYGVGSSARPYRAYGYGSGYRNRYYGRRYGYGRSQGSNRGVVARLRSVQMQLARLDHDYQGHRVRAMHQVSMAIRQLSHRSMIYSGVGFASGMNNGRGMGTGMGQGGIGRRGGIGGGGGGGIGGRAGAGRMSQAQSDARLGHALRTLQGVNMQLGNQGGFTGGHSRARGHVMGAIHELSVALSIR